MKIKSFILALCCTLYAAEAASQILREHVVDGSIYPLIDCTGLPEGMLMEKESADLAFADRVVVRHYGWYDHSGETFTIDDAHSNFCPNNKIVPMFIVSLTNFEGIDISPGGDSEGRRADWATAAGYNQKANIDAGVGHGNRFRRSCANLVENGLAWRLPTIRELEIIFTFKPVLEKFTGFAQFSARQYWSSTECLYALEVGQKKEYKWALTRGFSIPPGPIQQTSTLVYKEPSAMRMMSFRCVATVWTK